METRTESTERATLAQLSDVDALVDVVQLAYRGGLATVAWKNENHLVKGPRIDSAKMSALIEGEGTHVLKIEHDGTLAGCVLVEIEGDACVIGMLSVHPQMQNLKLGKRLVAAAEDFARTQIGSKEARMYVLSQRAELLEWYQRLGYEKNGERKEFPAEEEGSKPVDSDTYLVVIGKKL